MPGGVTPVIVLHDLAGALDNLTAEEDVLVIEVHAQQQSRIEQPVVVIGQLERPGLAAVQVTDVLTRAIGKLGAPDPEAAIVGERKAHHANTGEPAPLGGSLAQQVPPVLYPQQVVRLADQELTQRLIFISSVVPVADFQPVSRVLERPEELADSRPRSDERRQRSSCWYRRTWTFHP